MLSRFFIDRPVFAWVVAIVIMLCDEAIRLVLQEIFKWVA